MKEDKIIGILLLLLSLLVVMGFLFESTIYWYVIDALIVLVCGVSGVRLVRR
ncbi:MAG: hypothetical protein KAK00_05385 [Nanoarchaeota archaeon]|nr:hypothetical protein [Nanoarchaeota archaeon]